MKVKVFKVGEFKTKKARDLFPGEIIKIEEGEEVPVDAFLMKVTNRRNCCHFETTNLTDSHNVEVKKMPEYVEGRKETDPVEFINLYVNNSISCDAPNGDLYNFKGSLSTVGKPISLSYGRRIRLTHPRQLCLGRVLPAEFDGGLLGGALHRQQLQGHVREQARLREAVDHRL